MKSSEAHVRADVRLDLFRGGVVRWLRMQPRAIEGVEVSGGGAEVTLRHPQRGEIRLRGVAAAVWQQADGTRSVEDLAAAVGADVGAVWAALDELGDADLLTERVGPPAGIHEAVLREVTIVGDAGEAGREHLEAQFDRAAEQLPADAGAGAAAASTGLNDAVEAAHGDALAELEAAAEQRTKHVDDGEAQREQDVKKAEPESAESAAEQDTKAAQIDAEVKESEEEAEKASGVHVEAAAVLAEGDQGARERLRKRG